MSHQRSYAVGEQALPRPKSGKAGTVTRNARIIRGKPQIAKPPARKPRKITSEFSNWKPGSEGPGPTWDWRALAEKQKEEQKDKKKKK